MVFLPLCVHKLSFLAMNTLFYIYIYLFFLSKLTNNVCDLIPFITLFKITTMFCNIDNILRNIPHIEYECREYSTKHCQSDKILSWLWIMLYSQTCSSTHVNKGNQAIWNSFKFSYFCLCFTSSYAIVVGLEKTLAKDGQSLGGGGLLLEPRILAIGRGKTLWRSQWKGPLG